jgi:hypothetical protein
MIAAFSKRPKVSQPFFSHFPILPSSLILPKLAAVVDQLAALMCFGGTHGTYQLHLCRAA